MPSKPSLIILGRTTLVSEMEGISLKEATGSDLHVRARSVIRQLPRRTSLSLEKCRDSRVAPEQHGGEYHRESFDVEDGGLRRQTEEVAHESLIRFLRGGRSAKTRPKVSLPASLG